MKEEENKIPNKEQKSGTRHKQKHVWSGGFELHTRRVQVRVSGLTSCFDRVKPCFICESLINHFPLFLSLRQKELAQPCKIKKFQRQRVQDSKELWGTFLFDIRIASIGQTNYSFRDSIKPSPKPPQSRFRVGRELKWIMYIPETKLLMNK